VADLSLVQSFKLAVVDATGLSKDALHIYVGLIVWLLSAALWRKSVASPKPWFAALLVAVVVEAFDAFDDWVQLGRWRTGASLHDILNTMFWPTVLTLLARYTRLLK
jgi:hypothetical protein